MRRLVAIVSFFYLVTLSFGVPFPRQEPIVGFGLTNALGNLKFNQPVALASPPGETNRLFVVERLGRIMVVPDLTAPQAEVFLDLEDSTVAATGEAGLLGLAFHPEFARNGFFYVFRTTYDPDFRDKLSRFTVSDPQGNLVSTNSELTILSLPDVSDQHNAGDLHFGPDGYLYISTGEDGPLKDEEPEHFQAIDKGLFGGILRIDVDKRPGNLLPVARGDTGNYLIPADNPFVGATNFNGWTIQPEEVRAEFFAVGMRNPFRFSIDEQTGQIYVGDVGEGLYEEINLITQGGNYGWPFYEANGAGPFFKDRPEKEAFIEPYFQFGHGSSEFQGRAVIGGLVYRGGDLPGLNGKYIFGDHRSGHIWKLETSGANVQSVWLTSEPGLSCFSVDPRDGELLVANVLSGRIQRMIYIEPQAALVFPQTISDSQLFRNGDLDQPTSGLFPYEVNVPFWSDHALKRRWFSMGDSETKIVSSATEPWVSPPGAFWVKHFDLETTLGDPQTAQRLETRVLVRNSEGVYGLSYRWDSQGKDATLVPAQGASQEITILDGGILRTQIWRFPGRQECKLCHTAVAGYALSFNTAQLNRTGGAAGVTNQLDWLANHEFFTNSLTSPSSLPRLIPASETSWPVHYRVKSYLTANCSPCHQPDGGSRMLWDARLSTPLAHAGILDGQVVGPLRPTDRIISPMSLTNSMLYFRVSDSGPAKMPPLASSVTDRAALALLEEWILGIPQGPWQSIDLGSPGLEGSGSLTGDWLTVGAAGEVLRATRRKIKRIESLTVGAAGEVLRADSRRDSVHWMNQSLGPVSQIVAQLTSPIVVGSAGLMFRMTATDDSPVVALQASPDGNLELLLRSATNEPLVSIARTNSSANWFRLVRQEDRVNAWLSADGREWDLLGSVQWPTNSTDNSEFRGGFFAASGDTNRLVVARFKNWLLDSLGISSPSVATPVVLPVTIPWMVQSKSSSSNTPIVWLANSMEVARNDVAPYAWNWTNPPAGTYEVQGVLRSGTALSLTSAPVRLNVQNQSSGFWFESSKPVSPADAVLRFGLEGIRSPEPSWKPAQAATVTVLGTPNHVEGSAGQSLTNDYWQGTTSIRLRLSFKDFGTYRVGLYFWQPSGEVRKFHIQINDTDSQRLLVEREITIGEGGLLSSWISKGRCTLTITSNDGSPVFLNALLFDALEPFKVELKGPPEGSVLILPQTIPLEVVVEPEGRALDRVEFFVNSKALPILGAQTKLDWSSMLSGTNQVQVRVVDQYGVEVFSPVFTLNLKLPEAKAEYVLEDRFTQGTWLETYGKEGWSIPLDSTELPIYTGLEMELGREYSWGDPNQEKRMLLQARGVDHVLSCWVASEYMDFNLQFRDGNTHQLALYFVDGNQADRRERVEIWDATTKQLLDQRSVTEFVGGMYHVWDVRGAIIIRVLTENSVNAVVSGLFIGSSVTQQPLTITSQPESAVVATEGQPASFSVKARGTGPISYQWWRNGVAVEGQTNSTLQFTAVKLTDAGFYTATVTNWVSGERSAEVRLWVNPLGVGVKKWEFTTGARIYSTPTLGWDGTVYVGGWDRKVYALEGKYGNPRWEFWTGGEIFASPAVAGDGTVIVGSFDKKVYALDGMTGALKWVFETGGEIRASAAIGENGDVIVGSTDGRVYALSGQTGAKKWEFKTGGMIYSSAAIGKGGRIYVGSMDRKFYALDGLTGEKLWEFSTIGQNVGSPAIGEDGTVYFGSLNGMVYALNGLTGAKHWEFLTGDEVESSPVLGVDGTLFVGSDDNKVYALVAADGAKRWEFQTGGDVSSSPVVGSDGTVYVGSNDSNLYALEGATGFKKWQFPAGNRVYTPTIDSEGTLFVGSWNSNVVALATSSPSSGFSAWPMFGQNAQHSRNWGDAGISIELAPQPSQGEPEVPKITVTGLRGSGRILMWSPVLGVGEVWQPLTNVRIGPNGTAVVELEVGSSARYYRIQ